MIVINDNWLNRVSLIPFSQNNEIKRVSKNTIRLLSSLTWWIEWLTISNYSRLHVALNLALPLNLQFICYILLIIIESKILKYNNNWKLTIFLITLKYAKYDNFKFKCKKLNLCIFFVKLVHIKKKIHVIRR